ncbi:uncharacterized protein N7529_004531 [Penicillium soppii]|jgi:hypothetical protein|uniref:uncharacterized protein n=1 Tax=Penicillium soppii TaxID=69789 RepID=UPI0025484BB3|nr:uncharacterized protein N7529_004531 [Penicillium soppii]KAJ5872178.1 hypothetical protein N7529_004531 [Penicillium soppii]
MHSLIALANSSPLGRLRSSPLSVYPGHPAMMHSRANSSSSFRPGHPVMMHSRTGIFALRTCLKAPPTSADFLSALSSFTPRKKKKSVCWPSEDSSLAQVRYIPSRYDTDKELEPEPKSKLTAILFAPSGRLTFARFIVKLPGSRSRPRFEARPSLAWSSVRRARVQGKLPVAPTSIHFLIPPPLVALDKSSRTTPVDFAPQIALATSKIQHVSAPTSQALVCLPPKSSPVQGFSPVDASPQPVSAASSSQYEVDSTSQVIIRFPQALTMVKRRINPLSSPLAQFGLLVLALGFLYPEIWTLALLFLAGYMTIHH